MWLSKPACTMSQNFKKRKVDWTRPHKSLWGHDPQWPKNLPLGAICWRFYRPPQMLPWKQSLEHIWEAFLQTSHLVPSPLPPMWLTFYIYQTLMMSQGLWGAINFSFFLFLLTDLSSSSVILIPLAQTCRCFSTSLRLLFQLLNFLTLEILFLFPSSFSFLYCYSLFDETFFP